MNQHVCPHHNVSITVYEMAATVYTVEGGEIDLGGEALKPDPTGEIRVDCQDCGEDWFFETEESLEEPWKAMVYRIFHEVSSS